MKQRTINAIIMAILISFGAAGCGNTTSSDISSASVQSSTVVTEKTQTSSQAAESNPATTTTTSAAQTDSSEETNSESVKADAAVSESSDFVAVSTSFTGSANGAIDTTDAFSDRDLKQEADLSKAETITVKDGENVEITEAGIYVLTGTASDMTVTVNADSEAKVQLVLDGLEINNSSAPAITVASADKVFITTAEGSISNLNVTGAFSGEEDAVIYSKDDLVFGGLGTLNISSSGKAIDGKDDVKFTGGTYNITAGTSAVKANDTIMICGGTFNIDAGSDAFHSENTEDDSQGLVYIADGTFNISAGSDGIQGNGVVQIDGGSFDISASEGIESTFIQINGGTITISASDDGINATNKSSAYSVAVEINGGDLNITMGQGDTDAVDANGNIYVNGGNINITSTVSSFDYDGTAEYNGGTIIINGEQVSEIPMEMMGGGMMGGGRGGMMPGDMGDMGGMMQGGMGARA